jgi:RHS repeat-associated protein
VTKTQGAQVTSYTYDAIGNLRHVTLPNATTVDYVIDGQSRRVGKKVCAAPCGAGAQAILQQGFLYADQLHVVAELTYDASGILTDTTRFVYGSKANVPDFMVKGGVAYRILSDHLGSPRLVVNATSGVVMQRIDYDEFGNVTSETLASGFTPIPFGFAGGLYDRDTKLVRFGARDYDANVGRWAAKDPIRFGGGLNLYGYVLNDPVNLVDPGGLWAAGGSIEITVVAPILSGGGGTYGVNLEYTSSDGWGLYVYGPTGTPSEGFAAGLGAQLNVATGCGPWSGDFFNAEGSYGLVGGSLGAPGVSTTTTNYTPILGGR